MSQTFLEQLWAARQVILNGLAVSVSISLLAIAAGSVLGVLAGLALTYGGRAARLALRTYIDIVRGTPVLVLVLASYYVSAAIGLDLGPFAAGVLALAVFCSSHVGEIVRARAAGHSGPDRSRQGHRPELRPDLLVGAVAAGAAPMPAGLGQHGGRDGQGVHPAVRHRRGRAAAAHAGDHLAQLREPPVLFPGRRPVLHRELRHRAPGQIRRAQDRAAV